MLRDEHQEFVTALTKQKWVHANFQDLQLKPSTTSLESNYKYLVLKFSIGGT